jgi:hypothetical protein
MGSLVLLALLSDAVALASTGGSATGDISVVRQCIYSCEQFTSGPDGYSFRFYTADIDLHAQLDTTSSTNSII